MVWVDYVILAIVLISGFFSLLRGFVREAVSLTGWVLAVWAGITFMGMAANMLSGYISVPSVRQGVGFFVIFAGILVLTALINLLAGKLIDSTGLSATDRMLGMVFGMARGGVIVAVLVLGAGMTALPRDPWWSQSAFIPHFQQFAEDARTLLPPDIASAIRFR